MSGSVHIRRAGGTVSDFRSCNVELRTPNEVRTNGTERRLIFDSLREPDGSPTLYF